MLYKRIILLVCAIVICAGAQAALAQEIQSVAEAGKRVTT
jgi:hypothetical protein